MLMINTDEEKNSMIALIWVVIILAVEYISPKYVSLVIILANFFVPDAVPVIDEVLGLAIGAKKLME